MITTLTDFLLARIAEDEAAARAANGPHWASGDGNVSEGGLYALDGDTSDGWSIAWFELGTANVAEDGGRQLPRWPQMRRHAHENSVHAARHDPARVLAECEAKRRIVELRATTAYHAEQFASTPPDDPFRIVYTTQLSTYDAVLRALALPYADHPDWREEWGV